MTDTQSKSQVEIDYNRIFERMESIIQTELANVHLQSNVTPPRVSNNTVQSRSPQANSFTRSEARSITTLSPERVTQLIQGWGVKYDGEPTGPSVQEFLYRVSALTEDCLSGDFPMLCKNLHVLLTGKAREWYWRFRKENRVITLEEFCLSLKSHYQDFKDDDILMEEIRARKQREGESFELYYESIMKIAFRLVEPLDEYRLTQQLLRNLLPDIRQALLFVPISSVAHLKQLIYKR